MSMLSTRDTVLRDYIELKWGSAGCTPREKRGIAPSSPSIAASELLRSGTTVVTDLIITPLQEHETAYVVACSEEGNVGVFDPEAPRAPVMERNLGARVACTCAVQVPKSGDSKCLSVVVIFTTSGRVYVVASRSTLRKWAGEQGLQSSLSSSDSSSAGDTPEKSERFSFDDSSFETSRDFINSTPRSGHPGSKPSSPASPASPASPTSPSSSATPASPASPDVCRSPHSPHSPHSPAAPASPASPPPTPYSHSSSVGLPSPRTKVLEGAPPPSPSLPTLDSFEAPSNRRRPSSVGEHRATSPTIEAAACPFLVLRVHAPQNQLRSTRSCTALGKGELLLGASRTVLRCRLRVQNVAPAAGTGSTPSQRVTLDRLYGWHTRSTVTCVLGTRIVADTNDRECVAVTDDDGLSRSRSTSDSGPWALAGQRDGACAVIRSTMDVGDEGDVFGWDQAKASGGRGWDHVVEYIDTAPGIGSDNMSGGSAEHDVGDAGGSSVEFSVVGMGRMAGGTTQHSSSDLAVAIALLDGRVMMLGEYGIRCCISVEHQLQCLNCTDITGDGLNEILVCGLDGATFIIDRHQNVMRYQFPGRVAAFTAARCAIRSGGDVEPCIGIATFDNRTLIFSKLDISSIGLSTIVARVQHLFEDYRVLKENTGSLEWTSDEQASLLHSCLYHSVGTSHHITYKCALEQKLKDILAENDALEHRLLEHRKQLRDRA